jgi:virginiamycin B lyase
LAQQIAIGEYPVTTFDSGPEGITAGPDGALWFTEENMGRIGRITVAGSVREWVVPASVGNSIPEGITVGPDGALWFTDTGGNNIGRITTAGTITEYPLPTSNADPVGIVAGSDGALWFTESNGARIGRITTSGQITQYIGLKSSAQGITAGADGALWFTENTADGIGRITTSGELSFYALPTANSSPYGITPGPDGALWFTEYAGNKIGRITTAGVISEYAVPTPNSTPQGITAGSNGALWFTESGRGEGSKIGSITTAGVITEFSVPTAKSGPWGITSGPDGELWFTEYLGNNIGEALFVSADLSATPDSGAYQTEIAFGGSAFAPNETVEIYSSGVGSAVLASATADSAGSFTTAARAPISPYGPRLFVGVGQSSGKLGAASFSTSPKLVVSPASGPVGTTVSASGYGFGSFEQVTLYWNSPRILLGIVTAGFGGAFEGDAALTFLVPSGSPSGRNKVIGIGGTTGAKGSGFFTVE